MGLISNHLKKENLKSKKDLYLIDKLSGILHKGTLEFQEWQDSGRFNERKHFEKSNQDENLHIDCTDIVQYLGDLYIQVLKSGVFFLDVNLSSKSLDVVEKIVWDKNKDLFFDK